MLAKDEKVDWNIRDTGGWTPLMRSINYKRSEDASIILDIPTVDVDVTDNHGNHVEDVARYPVLYLDGSVCKPNKSGVWCQSLPPEANFQHIPELRIVGSDTNWNFPLLFPL